MESDRPTPARTGPQRSEDRTAAGRREAPVLMTKEP